MVLADQRDGFIAGSDTARNREILHVHQRPGQPDHDPYYFHVFNANKKSITVNLKSPKGLDLVKDMIRRADVMIENFAPGAIEGLGLSYLVVTSSAGSCRR